MKKIFSSVIGVDQGDVLIFSDFDSGLIKTFSQLGRTDVLNLYDCGFYVGLVYKRMQAQYDVKNEASTAIPGTKQIGSL